MTEPDLSVVVPALNEAARLPDTIARLRAFVRDHGSAEVVVAADTGSTDGTVEVAEGLAEQSGGEVQVTRVPPVGKGHGVMCGVRAARGRVVLMADADLSVDPSEFAGLAAHASQGAVAIASRNAPGARRLGEPRSRYLLGRAFNMVVRATILPRIRDSQCGFKALPRQVALELLDRQQATGWVFDVELLALARRKGLPIVEVAVTWHYGHESTMRPARDAPRVVAELWRVFRRCGRVRAPHGSR